MRQIGSTSIYMAEIFKLVLEKEREIKEEREIEKESDINIYLENKKVIVHYNILLSY